MHIKTDKKTWLCLDIHIIWIFQRKAASINLFDL